MMGTRSIALTKEERDFVGVLLENAWKMADDWRMGTRPGSPQEAQAEDYQIKCQNIQAKLAGRTDEL